MIRHDFTQSWCCSADGGPFREITVPHDAMQAQGREAGSAGKSSEAYFRSGSYRYEKVFTPEDSWQGKYLALEFEGVYPTAEVYLNGEHIGGCAYGYSRFRVPLEKLIFGRENTLAVEADNTRQPTSRWYPGAGIYRPVWLLEADPAHVIPDGLRVTTLSLDPARILVETEHTGQETDEISVEIRCLGEKIASGTGTRLELEIPDAKLWSAEAPHLYTCAVTLSRQGRVLDRREEPFGIRLLSWSYEQGFQVNGKTVKLKGGCVHHDNGILGSRSFRESEWRRVRKMKEFGFNAIRSAHNPISAAALEACDALGMYVMDESWDMWNKSKSDADYASRFLDHYEEDLRSMVGKDYNHPCVVMYSMGNEVTEPARPEGVELGKQIFAKLKALDPTRPITAGINPTLIAMALMQEQNPEGGPAREQEKMDSTAYNKMVSEMGKRMVEGASNPMVDQASTPMYGLLDISGYNYASSRYELDRQLHPGRIIVGSETFPCYLATDWPVIEKLPYVVGDFMWTAWDYLGEVGLGAWAYQSEDADFAKPYPWLLADSGAFDILGHDNAEAGLASVVWGHRHTPYIGVCPANHPGQTLIKAIWRGTNAIPSWSWAGCEGNPTTVEVYTAAAEAELLLNGVSLGRKKVEEFKAEFPTRYRPGQLKAVAYNADGTVHSESVLRSAEGRTRLRVLEEPAPCDRPRVRYLDIALVGENGEVQSSQDTVLTVTVEGGRLLAFGSANPKTEESFLTGTYKTYYGRAQAVILPEKAQVTVTVAGEEMSPAELVMEG